MAIDAEYGQAALSKKHSAMLRTLSLSDTRMDYAALLRDIANATVRRWRASIRTTSASL
jgi:hypothetical protein